MTVADYLVSFLSLLGVKHVYGYPGSPLVPLLAALQRQDAVRWVLMRHENAAALAAGAHARLTGQLGVCVATSGPGALNFVCGVADSHLDRAPVLALTGLVPTASQGHWEFQDVNQTALLAAVLPPGAPPSSSSPSDSGRPSSRRWTARASWTSPTRTSWECSASSASPPSPPRRSSCGRPT